MKNIYNISKLKLVVLWIFGIIFTAGISDGCGYNTNCGSLENGVMTIVFFVEVFYTIGWFEARKKNLG